MGLTLLDLHLSCEKWLPVRVAGGTPAAAAEKCPSLPTLLDSYMSNEMPLIHDPARDFQMLWQKLPQEDTVCILH